jgi:hypothetical protein
MSELQQIKLTPLLTVAESKEWLKNHPDSVQVVWSTPEKPLRFMFKYVLEGNNEVR